MLNPLITLARRKVAKKLNKKLNASKTRAFNKKMLDLSIRSVADNIVASADGSISAFYRLSNSSYDFLDDYNKSDLMYRINEALVSVSREKRKPVEGFLISDSVPFDVQAWIDHNEIASKNWEKPEFYQQFMREEEDYLLNNDFMKKEVYLGIVMEKEIDEESVGAIRGVSDGISFFKDLSNSILRTRADVMTKEKEAQYRVIEDGLFRTLSGSELRAQRATAEEILLLVKRPFYPSMPSPYIDVDRTNRYGSNEIVKETGHAIWNRVRHLEISQIVGDREIKGYRACLTLSDLPKSQSIPEDIPIFQFVDKAFPYVKTAYCRFVIHPKENMQKQFGKVAKESRDELESFMTSVDTLDSTMRGNALPVDLEDKLSDKDIIEELLTTGEPWIEGSYHIVVEAESEKKLIERCTAIRRQMLSDLRISVRWTSGDQMKLFLQQLPGDRRRVDVYDQTTTATQVAASGMNLSPNVGDEIRPKGH